MSPESFRTWLLALTICSLWPEHLLPSLSTPSLHASFQMLWQLVRGVLQLRKNMLTPTHNLKNSRVVNEDVWYPKRFNTWIDFKLDSCEKSRMLSDQRCCGSGGVAWVCVDCAFSYAVQEGLVLNWRNHRDRDTANGLQCLSSQL